MRKLIFIFIVLTTVQKNYSQTGKYELDKARRENKNGWIYIHLEGSPFDIGYQHGYLLANDIDTCIQAL
jgi:hypothetical protein